MDDLTRRAHAAYFRTGGVDQPQAGPAVTEYRGKRYVVLRNARGVLAIYRVLPNGLLKRLRRPPKELLQP